MCYNRYSVTQNLCSLAQTKKAGTITTHTAIAKSLRSGLYACYHSRLRTVLPAKKRKHHKLVRFRTQFVHMRLGIAMPLHILLPSLTIPITYAIYTRSRRRCSRQAFVSYPHMGSTNSNLCLHYTTLFSFCQPISLIFSLFFARKCYKSEEVQNITG